MEYGGVSITYGPFELATGIDLPFVDWVELYYPSDRHQKYLGDLSSVNMAVLEGLASSRMPDVLRVTLLGFADVPHQPRVWLPPHESLAGTDAASVAEVLAEAHRRNLRPLTGYEGLLLGTLTSLPQEPLSILCLGMPVETPDGVQMALKLNLDPERYPDLGLNTPTAWDTSIPCWTHHHFAMCEAG